MRKCVIWDLDNTVWDGVLLEGEVTPRPDVLRILETLDRRGIVHAIASRNHEPATRAALVRHNLDDWFVARRINWQAKPMNLRSISEELRLSLDALVFVDDDAFERAQVNWALPEVETVDARDVVGLLDELDPGVVSAEARRRRTLYREEACRREAAQTQSRQAFLDGCGMEITVRPMEATDVERVLELMSRTHQLNTTGRIFSRDEVVEQANILVASLRDRFGDYGTIGVAISEGGLLSYLAISCRVMGRGVERALLATVLDRAALLKDTGTNRAMRVLYQMSGLVAGELQPDGTQVFAVGSGPRPTVPSWIEVHA
jgi:FkbH-like protein